MRCFTAFGEPYRQASQARISNCIPQYFIGCNYISLPKIPDSAAKYLNYAIKTYIYIFFYSKLFNTQMVMTPCQMSVHVITVNITCEVISSCMSRAGDMQWSAALGPIFYLWLRRKCSLCERIRYICNVLQWLRNFSTRNRVGFRKWFCGKSRRVWLGIVRESYKCLTAQWSGIPPLGNCMIFIR